MCLADWYLKTRKRGVRLGIQHKQHQGGKKIESHGGSVYDLNGNPSYEIKNIPFIYRNKVAYAPTKKLLLRFFKDRADTINNYLDTHKVNFTDFHQVYQLMTAIK